MPARQIEELIALLARLPGFGPRSARRTALHLIRHPENTMLPLASALTETAEAIQACSECGNLDTASPCSVCADDRRDMSQICVVEDVGDLWALERSRMYKGLYHVLGGTLSAIEGRGPEELRLDQLARKASDQRVLEVIIATNATVEGQTTAHYITDKLAEANVRITRLAQGIPFGGELDYLDDGTLGAAFKARVGV